MSLRQSRQGWAHPRSSRARDKALWPHLERPTAGNRPGTELEAGERAAAGAACTCPPGTTHLSSRYPPRMSWHSSVRGLRLCSGGWRWASGTAQTLNSSSLLGCQASSSSRPDRKKLTGSVVPVSKYRAGEATSRDGVNGVGVRWGGAQGGPARPLTWQGLRAGVDGRVQHGGSQGLRRRLEAARGEG